MKHYKNTFRNAGMTKNSRTECSCAYGGRFHDATSGEYYLLTRYLL